jgi:hypothetical protein
MRASGATKRHHCGGIEPPIQSLIERFSAGAFLLRCLQDRTPEIICVNDAFDEALGRWFGADFERARPLAAERVFPECQSARKTDPLSACNIDPLRWTDGWLDPA